MSQICGNFGGCGGQTNDPTTGPFDGCAGPRGVGDGIQGGVGGKDVTDPVNLANGCFYFELPLLSTPCFGPAVNFKLTYRSKSGYDDATFGMPNPDNAPRFDTGWNWEHSANIFVSRNVAGGLSVHNGTGRVDWAPLPPGGNCVGDLPWTPEIELCDESIGSGGQPQPPTVKARDGTVFTFGASGLSGRSMLSNITDIHGSQVNYTYSNNELATITDPCGRKLRFIRQHIAGIGPSSKKMLTAVEELGPNDVVLRVVELTYFTTSNLGTPAQGNVGDLKQVTLKAPNGGGPDRTWSFTYFSGDEPHETNLHTITDPRNNLILENIYESDPLVTRPVTVNDFKEIRRVRRYDSVVKQYMPDPATNTEREYDYVYFAGDQPANQSVNDLVNPTLVINRAGDVKVLSYGSGEKNGFLMRRLDYTGRVPDFQNIQDDRSHFIGQVEIAYGLASATTRWSAIDQKVKDLLTGTKLRADDPPVFDTRYDYAIVVGNQTGLLSHAWLPGNTSTDTGQADVFKDYSSIQATAGMPTLVEQRTGTSVSAIRTEMAYGEQTCGCNSAEGATAIGRKQGSGGIQWHEERDYYDATNRVRVIRRGELNGLYNDPPTDENAASNLSTLSRETGEESREWFTYTPILGFSNGTIPPSQLLTHSMIVQYGDNAGIADVIRKDEYSYFPINSTETFGGRGKVKEVIRNAGGTAAQRSRTTYEYDVFGNTTSVKAWSDVGSPAVLLNHSLFTYNAYGWLLSEESRNASGQALARTEFKYDANGNVIREDVMDAGPTLALATGSPISTIRDYDAFDRLIRESAEVIASPLTAGQTSTSSPANLKTWADANNQLYFITTEYVYDANDNVALIRKGEAASGASPRQPDNVVSMQYDERNRVLLETRGSGATATSTRFDYDPRGNLIRRVEGVGSSTPRTTTYELDAFDRVVKSVDPMGNVRGNAYDLRDNVTDSWTIGTWGEDLAGAQANPAYLSYTRSTLNRLGWATKQTSYNVQSALSPLAAPASAPLSDTTLSGLTKVETLYAYFPDGRISEITDPRGFKTRFVYDALRRLTDAIDQEGNVTRHSYDAAYNRLSSFEIEFPDDGLFQHPTPGNAGTPRNMLTARRYESHATYDALNRPISTIDGVGYITQYQYDSRGNMVAMIDPRQNRTLFAYDGLGRKLTESREMCAANMGEGPCDPNSTDYDLITTTQVWDRSSRLVAQIDDNGNPTSYWYDGQDRPVLTRMADGTIHSIGMPTQSGGAGVTWDGFGVPQFPSAWLQGYDVLSNPVYALDANGSRITSTFDLNGRTLTRTIVTGSGGSFPVVGADSGRTGTNNELYKYDSLSRMLLAKDDDTEVVREYDGLSRLAKEKTKVAQWVNSAWSFTGSAERVVSYGYDAGGNVETITYPNARVVTHVYNKLSRLQSLHEGTPNSNSEIASYEYYGAQRPTARIHANGTRTDYVWEGWKVTSGSSGNWVWQGGIDHTTDRRLVRVTNRWSSGTSNIDRRTLAWDAASNKIAAGSAPLAAGPGRWFEYDSANRMVASTFATYALDGVHNRTSVSGSAAAGAQLGDYTMLDEFSFEIDRPVNQYSTTPLDRAAYDENGNLTEIGAQSGGGFLMAAGVQPGSAPLHSSVNEAINQGGLWADVTSDGQVASDDIGYVLELLQGQDAGGHEEGEPMAASQGCDEFDPTCGPMRLATLRYDYRNQMVEYENTMGAGTPLARYQYDAFGRRVARVGDALYNAATTTTIYVYGGQASWQVLAEYPSVSATSADATYVYGNYIDEPITMTRDFDGVGSGTLQTFYYHQDDLFTVVALTAGGPNGVSVPSLGTFAAGDVVERYRYGDYGSPSIRTASGADAGVLSSIAKNPYLFTGREWDGETRLYYYRTRYMEPTWGRFTTRDTIGTWGDPQSKGGAAALAASSPSNNADGFGTTCYAIDFFDHKYTPADSLNRVNADRRKCNECAARKRIPRPTFGESKDGIQDCMQEVVNLCGGYCGNMVTGQHGWCNPLALEPDFPPGQDPPPGGPFPPGWPSLIPLPEIEPPDDPGWWDQLWRWFRRHV